MADPLVQQFVEYELSSSVRQLLKDAIADPEPRKALREFAFNRFDVALDFERRVAVIQDDLDSSTAGRVELELEQFARLLE